MVTTLIYSDELSVLGGPAKVEVSVDLGPQGPRGSQIYAGLGQPNVLGDDIGFVPNLLDLYINILTSDEEYLFIYQYENFAGTPSWKKLLKLIPNVLSKTSTNSFVAGEATINIPVASIVPLTNISNITSANFNIQYTIANNLNPLSSTISVGDLVTMNDELVLPLTIKAIEFDGTDWIDLAGQKTTHIFITVV